MSLKLRAGRFLMIRFDLFLRRSALREFLFIALSAAPAQGLEGSGLFYFPSRV